MVDADALDLYKENIQPLRQGRKTDLLGLALQAQTNDGIQQQLLKERDEFELLIRMYEGPDPLKPRYDYVLWLEQSYPKHGREINLIPLLEDTITVFKDDERYKQDPRFIELIIKFFETQVNPLELFQAVYNLGIGTKCSLLYKSWAEEFSESGDLKRADQIFSLGISNRAEPLESLQQEHKQFQSSVFRKLLSGAELPQPPPERTSLDPSRHAFGKLKSKVGSSRPTYGRAGVVPLCLSNKNVPQKSNAPISIYQDSNDNETGVNNIENYQIEHLPKSDFSKKENSVKAGPWTSAYKTSKHHHRQHHTYTPTTPSFKVHEDMPDATQTPMTPMSVCPSALKPRKIESFQCPIALFEPPDPSVRPMYCKNKIYVGGREFQMEEVRAAMYYKKMRKEMIHEEMEKLSLKTNHTDLLLTTPQALRNDTTPSTGIKAPITPCVSKVPSGSETPLTINKLATPHIPNAKIPQRVIFQEPMTPCQSTSHHVPVTPFDLPSQIIHEVNMEGVETVYKVKEPHQPSESLVNKAKLAKSNVKKLLNFTVFCDED